MANGLGIADALQEDIRRRFAAASDITPSSPEGIGLSAPTDAVPPAEEQLQEQPADESGEGLSFGGVMGSVGRGIGKGALGLGVGIVDALALIKGRPLLSSAIREKKIRDKKRARDAFDANIRTFKSVVGVLDNFEDPELRKAAAVKLAEQLDQQHGMEGFGDLLEMFAGDEGASDMIDGIATPEMREQVLRIQELEGDEAVSKFLRDPEAQAKALLASDRKEVSTVAKMAHRVISAAEARAPKEVAEARKNGLTLEEFTVLHDANARENQFSRRSLRAITRNTALFDDILGIETPSEQKVRQVEMEAEVRERAKKRFANPAQGSVMDIALADGSIVQSIDGGRTIQRNGQSVPRPANSKALGSGAFPDVDTFLVPTDDKGGRKTVQSFDGGRTFVENGEAKPMPAGSIPLSKGDVQLSADDVLGFGDRATEGARAAVSEQIGKLATIRDLNREMDRLGRGSVGFRATVAETLAGTVGSVHKGMGQFLSESIADVDPEELASFRAKVSAFVASSIQILTGEASGRVTEAERRLAALATRLNDPTASIDQARGALQAMLQLSAVVADRKSFEGGLETPFDVSTEEATDKTLRILIGRLGMTGKTAGDTVNEIRDQRALLGLTGLGASP